jgi:glycosyltransferase involved in cell wall biosynthesis
MKTPPRWSVMIPVYKPDDLLRQTLLAAITARDACGESMQLEIVDDASPDCDVAALLASWGIAGVPVFRRTVNGGLGRCWNTCVARAQGELVHILHQDDWVEPQFYARMSVAARAFPEAGMLFCRTRFEEGKASLNVDVPEQSVTGPIPGWLEKICAAQRLQCPAVVVRRSVYTALGGFDEALRYVIDWEMWIRIAAYRAVAYVPMVLAVYRVHSNSQSARLKAAGAITDDLSAGLDRIARTLGDVGRPECFKLAQAYAWHVTGQLAYEAETARRFAAAASELSSSLRRFGRGAGLARIVRRLRWYLRLRLRSLGWWEPRHAAQ